MRSPKSILVFLVLSMAATSAGADESSANLCQDSGIVLAFLNGVQTTKEDAIRASNELVLIHGTSSPTGEPIRYEVLYNYTAGLEDFVETFEQRLSEHGDILEGKYELFLEALWGGGPFWDDQIAEATALGDLLTGLTDWLQAAAIEDLSSLIATPPSTETYSEHQARIDTWTLEGQKILFVAHSQGNLFANAAYDYARKELPAESVAVVHIAPASPTVRGEHTLADLDLVINGLRLLGDVQPVTNNIPGYVLRPPGLNGQTDPLGHGLLEIYLNPRLDISNRVFQQIQNAMQNLEAPEKEASSGFFTVTLTWSGSGDADLHTFEPNEQWVFFQAPEGTSGFLDVDNRVGQGPEHYFATCDRNRLQVGTYLIAVANYAEATGRVATVQVSSERDGVLGTRFVQLGEATEYVPSNLMFEVVVEYDEESDQCHVSVL